MEKSREYRKTNPGLGAPKLHAILKKMFDDTGCFLGRDAFIEMLRKHGLMVRIKRRRRYKTTRTPYLAGRRSPQDLSVVPVLADAHGSLVKAPCHQFQGSRCHHQSHCRSRSCHQSCCHQSCHLMLLQSRPPLL